MMQRYGRGWYFESHRHSLAARGIKTSFQGNRSFTQIKFTDYRRYKELARRALYDNKLEFLMTEVFKRDPLFEKAAKEVMSEEKRPILQKPRSEGIAALGKADAQTLGKILSKQGELLPFERQRMADILGGGEKGEALAKGLIETKDTYKTIGRDKDIRQIADKIEHLRGLVLKGGPDFEYALEDIDRTVDNLKRIRKDMYGAIAPEVKEMLDEVDNLKEQRRTEFTETEAEMIEMKMKGEQLPFGYKFERETAGGKAARLRSLKEEKEMFLASEEGKKLIADFRQKFGKDLTEVLKTYESMTPEERKMWISRGLVSKPRIEKVSPKTGIAALDDELHTELYRQGANVNLAIGFYEKHFPHRTEVIQKLEDKRAEINKMHDKFEQLEEARVKFRTARKVRNVEQQKAVGQEIVGLEKDLGIEIPQSVRKRLGVLLAEPKVEGEGAEEVPEEGRGVMKGEVTDILMDYKRGLMKKFPSSVKLSKGEARLMPRLIKADKEAVEKDYEAYLKSIRSKEEAELEEALEFYHKQRTGPTYVEPSKVKTEVVVAKALGGPLPKPEVEVKKLPVYALPKVVMPADIPVFSKKAQEYRVLPGTAQRIAQQRAEKMIRDGVKPEIAAKAGQTAASEYIVKRTKEIEKLAYAAKRFGVFR
jgi:hypothetical protein